jgi:CRISPR/Cas system CMR-associated protein Cmr1 (group 7 of RAMP superfamily)
MVANDSSKLEQSQTHTNQSFMHKKNNTYNCTQSWHCIKYTQFQCVQILKRENQLI